MKHPKQPSNSKKASSRQEPNPIYKPVGPKCDPYDGLYHTHNYMMEAYRKEMYLNSPYRKE